MKKVKRSGQAGVIGGIIIVTIIFSIILPLILYYQRSTEYVSTQANTEINFLNDKIRESVTAVGSSDASTITANNTGSIPVTIVRLWLLRGSEVERIVDLNDNSLITGVYLDGDPISSNVLPTIQPGSTLTITLDTSQLANPSQLYFYLESDRGVLHPRRRAQPLVEAPEIPNEIIQLIGETSGPIIYWFFSLKYYEVEEVEKNNYRIDLSDGYSGFIIPSNKDIVFEIEITNYDPSGRSITISNESHIELYSIKTGEAFEKKFNIVSVDENGYIDSFSEVTLGHGSSTLLYFRGTTPNKRTEAFLSIILVGSFSDGTPYGQNIAVIGVRIV